MVVKKTKQSSKEAQLSFITNERKGVSKEMTEKSTDAMIHDKDKIDSKDERALSPNENGQSQYKDTIYRNFSKDELIAYSNTNNAIN